MRVIVDRFEEDLVVCEKEDKSTFNLKREQVPKEVEEGDVLIIEGDKVVIDREETQKRKKQMEELTKDMWE
ncbi:DUF3006 domain-containing protein (plasmid) [Aneurinibacillus sp. Ricciae_BoGa-3]|uniref:DUF3006 domain-containing protein n=1 Tax=Aneurinibacillus sp. Ricciae_BoGa-3 TaxID=3022697 RepID=UPI0023415FDA|nr:DUF3006 domain-containing protein [Aneurinibacillus sp. Ricciae_BoGa-3]WCK57209.1 DUF3006 domain-containing protein [Aneurinibacillus sp. Ricciae_BoGa-3]